jgi:DNA adenine methylase
VSSLKPILKWAGAKTKLVPDILALIPPTSRRLVEPFLGSAAVALNLGFDQNLLADSNPDIIGLYQSLALAPEEFVCKCRELFTPQTNTAERYYSLRDEFNASRDVFRRACLFVYLNRHGYNGLCRYNNKGGFNVPFGKYDAPYFPSEEFAHMTDLVQKSKLQCADFRSVLAEAGSDDFVYCDPPYSPASETSNFTSYAKGGFTHTDQRDLLAACTAAAQRGATVVISNHDTPVTRELYADATYIRALRVSRLISCDGATRAKASELLVVYSKLAFAMAL